MKLNHKEGTNTLTSALGITEERHTALQTFIEGLVENHPDTVSDTLSQIAEKCDTPEELAWAVFGFTHALDTREFTSIFSGSLAPAGMDEDAGGDAGIDD